MGTISSELSRTISSGAEQLTASVDDISIPYESQLQSYAQVSGNGTVESGLLDSLQDLKDKINGLTTNVVSLLLDATAYNDAYTSALLTSLTSIVSSNLTAGGTGLPAATESTMWSRMRERQVAQGNRGVNQARIELNKRLPYTGMIADIYLNANKDFISATSEGNRDISYKQAELTYQQQRAVIAESMQKEGLSQAEYLARRERSLKAYSTYDELNIRNSWTYYETLIKAIVGHIQGGVEYLSKIAYGEDQQRFDNYLGIAKVLMDGQLKVSGQIAQLMPGGPLE